ncbi:MAG: dienelactone hydrolase family protein [Kiloniellales bacterium]
MLAPKLGRRAVMQGLTGVPLAAILANPTLARAAAAGLEAQSITTPGGTQVAAVLALPAKTPAPAVLLVHEWWGLNDQIKAMAAEFAKAGFTALAVDLYGGQVAEDRDAARSYMQALDPKAATETLVAWIDWLRRHEASTGRIGTVGWCFGGGWSLNASIAAPVDATVIYYGRVTRQADELKHLKGPVLGHFATQDKFINRDMVGTWEGEMKKAGKAFQSHWYEADHAFANPTGARYDEADAKLAWSRTLAFFRQHLRG